jgi:hypothetical protein
VEHRKGERRCLAGAGGRLSQQIPSFQQQRNRLALDRSGLLVSKRGDRIGRVPWKADAGKGDRRWGTQSSDDHVTLLRSLASPATIAAWRGSHAIATGR